jgi:hypothetical protein
MKDVVCNKYSEHADKSLKRQMLILQFNGLNNREWPADPLLHYIQVRTSHYDSIIAQVNPESIIMVLEVAHICTN